MNRFFLKCIFTVVLHLYRQSRRLEKFELLKAVSSIIGRLKGGGALLKHGQLF
jgi:hypothetical protein